MEDSFVQSECGDDWLAGYHCAGFSSGHAGYFSVYVYDVLRDGSSCGWSVWSNFNGQGDILNVRRSAYAGFHLMMALGVVLSSIVFLCRNYLGGWFTDSTEVAAMVTSLILPFLVYQFGDGLQITFANALRGISDVKLMMLICLHCLFPYFASGRLFLRIRVGVGDHRCLDGISFWVDQCRSDVMVAFPSQDETTAFHSKFII